MMSDGVWKCDQCGYSVGASWGQVSWDCPRCNGTPGFVEKLQEEKEKLQKENKKLKKKVKELEDIINPPYMGAGI